MYNSCLGSAALTEKKVLRKGKRFSTSFLQYEISYFLRGGWDSWICLTWRKLREDLVVTFNHLKWIRAQSQDPFIQQKQQSQTAAGEIPSGYMKEYMHAQALEWVTQRDVEICILGGVQSLTGYCPEEPVVMKALVLRLQLDGVGTAVGSSGPFQQELLYKFEKTRSKQDRNLTHLMGVQSSTTQ